MKVLIVDDEKENLYLLERMLEKIGYEVEIAEDGKQALEKLYSDNFQMVISDILMPVMDGFQLCKTVKSDKRFADLLFIFYTATYVEEKDEEFALSLGADKFLRKPLKPEKFIETIKALILNTRLDQIKPSKIIIKEEKELLKLYNERLIHKLEKKLVDLEKEITKRKQAEETLREVNEELRDFASIVAHDLKAPLRNITNLVEWLLKDSAKYLSEEGKDNLNLMVKQTTHMDALIDGIYQYSKIDRFQKKIEDLDLNKLLWEVIEILYPPENIEIIIPSELPMLAVDKTHMTQIFTNLIDNAIKFMNKPKGHITINYKERQNFWHFSVADNGPGIEERHFERIFNIFQTLSAKEEVKGIGLGLAIVKKVVEMNGGSIWLESTVGEGSTFHFTLQKL